MNEVTLWIGNAAAVAGILLCALSGITRLAGSYFTVGGLEVGTVFQLGIGLMVFACLAKLHLLGQGQGD